MPDVASAEGAVGGRVSVLVTFTTGANRRNALVELPAGPKQHKFDGERAKEGNTKVLLVSHRYASAVGNGYAPPPNGF